MKQEERRIWLIRELIKEQSQYGNTEIPQAQDEYLSEEAKEKGSSRNCRKYRKTIS